MYVYNLQFDQRKCIELSHWHNCKCITWAISQRRPLFMTMYAIHGKKWSNYDAWRHSRFHLCTHQSNFVNYKFSINSSTIASNFDLFLWFGKKLLTIPFAFGLDLFIDDVAICIWNDKAENHEHTRIALKWTVLLTLEFYYTILLMLVIRYYQLHSSHSFAIVLDGMLENGVSQIISEYQLKRDHAKGCAFYAASAAMCYLWLNE